MHMHCDTDCRQLSTRSRIPQLPGSRYDGHVRMSQQHITLNWYVGAGFVLKTEADACAVLVSVSTGIYITSCHRL